MNSTDMVTTFFVENAVMTQARAMLEQNFGLEASNYLLQVDSVKADHINLKESSFDWGSSRLHEAYEHAMSVARYDDDNPQMHRQIAEQMAEYLVDSDRIVWGSGMAVDDRRSDQTVGAFLMSDYAFRYASIPFSELVEAIKARQRKFGWKEVEVYVLRENGNFEFCQ